MEIYLTRLNYGGAMIHACRVRTKVRTEAVWPTMDLLATTMRTLMRTLVIAPSAGLRVAIASGPTYAGYKVSMQMASLSLRPAIRNAPDAIIVADGTSCRHQIFDDAARDAKHAMRVLADHLIVA